MMAAQPETDWRPNARAVTAHAQLSPAGPGLNAPDILGTGHAQ